MTPEIIRAQRDHERRLAYEETLESQAALPRIMAGGRLTLTTGTPVTSSDVTGAGTLYYTPYLHSQVWLYTSGAWRLYTFTQRSLSLTLTSGKNYDVFLSDVAGTLTLSLSSAWTNDTTRADALGTQDGVTVLSGTPGKLWLGTIRASGTNTTEDSASKRFVWNTYNRVPKNLYKSYPNGSWTYAVAAWRAINADSTIRCQFVIGETQEVHLIHTASITDENGGTVGIGLDSTTTSASTNAFNNGAFGSIFVVVTTPAVYNGMPSAGYHYLQAVEYSSNLLYQYGADQLFVGNCCGLTGWMLT